MLVEKTFTFEASHQIANHPGKCARLHGHSWVLTVSCIGRMNLETRMVVDYYDIKQAVQPIVDQLDHQHLGEGWVTSFEGFDPDVRRILMSTVDGIPPGFLPTSENLLFWIASQLPDTLPWDRLRLNETCTSSAVLSRREYTFSKGGSYFHGKEKGRKEGQQDLSTEEIFEKEVAIVDDDVPF